MPFHRALDGVDCRRGSVLMLGEECDFLAGNEEEGKRGGNNFNKLTLLHLLHVQLARPTYSRSRLLSALVYRYVRSRARATGYWSFIIFGFGSAASLTLNSLSYINTRGKFNTLAVLKERIHK